MKTTISMLTVLTSALVLSCVCNAADKYSPPRAADGHPDLSGVWSNGSVTNLTRPPGQKLVVSRAEAETIVKANPLQRLIDADDGPSNLKESITDDKNSDRGYNAFWIDPGSFLASVKGEYRTSWIVEPANGQMPLSDEGKKRIAADRGERRQKLWYGPEALPLPERCLIGFSGAGGPGMLNTMYNNNYVINQSADSVLIVVEMVHDVRSIPLFKDKATAQASHRPAALNLWLGDSVGWWEGDTLVVEVTNLNPTQGRAGPLFLSEKGKVTERFTRVSPTQIFYEFQVEDPVYYTQTWRVEESLNARKESIYEYACHEGNYAMEGILRGARNQEAQGIKPTEGPGIFGTPIPDKNKNANAR
ncbi:MAG TPA: hypothetical protein VET48_09625 [Steroidobacteraceae bacterium]|nr:hypothetical protein [Steroidobacteraceae bacterium]